MCELWKILKMFLDSTTAGLSNVLDCFSFATDLNPFRKHLVGKLNHRLLTEQKHTPGEFRRGTPYCFCKFSLLFAQIVIFCIYFVRLIYFICLSGEPTVYGISTTLEAFSSP